MGAFELVVKHMSNGGGESGIGLMVRLPLGEFRWRIWYGYDSGFSLNVGCGDNSSFLDSVDHDGGAQWCALDAVAEKSENYCDHPGLEEESSRTDERPGGGFFTLLQVKP